MNAHEIDYQIYGEEMQFVEIELDPYETVIAEAGSFMMMDDGIELATIFGDGSHKEENTGIWDKVFSAGKRLLTGESLFMTAFTHHGSGLMLGHALAEGVRPAHPGDAADIFLLLRDDVHRGAIRPVDEHGVAETLEQHLVYVIDGVVVGTARLIPHGDRAELSRFATLPRYRGRGRARALGEALIDRARAQGYAGVFALSIEARMWGFFESLGMSPADRATLPESWLAGYDLSRPSRAYALAF